MTPKLLKKYEQKGIFTIKQLSHLFRPRRSRKKTPRVGFKPELQALAIRTNKIYLQGPQGHARAAVEFFLDIEGVPDESFNYLIGLLLSNGQPLTCQSFWANHKENESEIWNAFLEAVGQYPEAPIYHYGRYETKAIESFAQKYGRGTEALKKRLVNVNSWIFGRVYFPARSNNLKELGKYLGARWTSPDASGLQSLVWRHRWEETADENLKQQLLTYNEEDCRALHLLVDTISKLKDDVASRPEVELADRPKRHASHVGKEIHRQFDWICKSAQADYDRNKINLRPAEDSDDVARKLGAPVGHQAYQRLIPRTVGKVIRVRPRKKCPRHHEPLQAREEVAETTIIDLVFTRNGCRKTATRHEGLKGFCQRCNRDYLPPGIVKLGNQLFGHAFQAWTIHQKIVLRLPYRIITDVMEDMFGERVSQASPVNFMASFAREYADTERALAERILQSPYIHADETRLNIQGTDHYVWVFTDGTHVIFRMTETREATVVREILKGYTGVLISDFYPGYDSMECAQQKCLVHLIRDLNDDLWSNPFNTEFESFVLAVRDLLLPILEAVDKYGSKKRYLRKFKKSVDRFYKKTITDKTCQSEVTVTYQKRFQRYRESLFVFLDHDNIPWNNNMAERAIREIAVQRKISGTFFKRASSPYLLLLAIAQSCRFQEKSFLKFLLSRAKEVDAFRSAKRKKISILVGPQRRAVEHPESSRTGAAGVHEQSVEAQD